MGCSNIKLCWCIGHMKSRVLVNILCDLGSYIGHMMLRAMLYVTLTPRSRPNKIFLLNAFLPKLLDIAASNFAGA